MADNKQDRRNQGTSQGDQQRQRTGQDAGAGHGPGPKGGGAAKQPSDPSGSKAPMSGGKAPMGGGNAPTGGGAAKAEAEDEDELGGESGDPEDEVIELDDDDRITQRSPAQREPERR